MDLKQKVALHYLLAYLRAHTLQQGFRRQLRMVP